MLINYLVIIILSLAQGLSEFLPVSSSGHLILLHEILPAVPINSLAFDVVLHLASALAVIIFFRQDFKEILVGCCQSLARGKKSEPARLAWLIIIATIPAALFGYWLESIIEEILRSGLIVAGALVAGGILFLITERLAKQHHDLTNLNWRQSLVIGCAQAVALIPGVSRSGITIIAGMLFKLNREAATRFSFLLSVPIILGANIKEAPVLAAASTNELFSLGLGFFMSFVFSYFTIKYFIAFVRKYSLDIFAYYRFLLAAVILWLWLS
ncbi:MAG: undecaprenyl-diphosphatase UppP [Patescibacteria group bacterium]